MKAVSIQKQGASDYDLWLTVFRCPEGFVAMEMEQKLVSLQSRLVGK